MGGLASILAVWRATIGPLSLPLSLSLWLSLSLLLALPAMAGEAGTSIVRPTDHIARLAVPGRLTKEKAIRQVPAINPGEYFVPPELNEIPVSKYGEMALWGRDIFIDTQTHARRYVGNGLNCASCHLNEGRKPFAAPLWAAVPMYPVYHTRLTITVTLAERMQRCFRYSLDGIAPTIDAPELKALITYAHWLATGAPTGINLPGRGFSKRPSKPRDAAAENGEDVYQERCALCHGDNGEGRTRSDGRYQFPPVWGMDSFNRGAGMNNVKTCAEFVRANMPLGLGWSLSGQESWDVCTFIWLHDRPWNPDVNVIDNIFNEPQGR